MVGFNLSREEPNSHPNLCSRGFSFFIRMRQHVSRARTRNSHTAYPADVFTEREHKRIGSELRAAAANGDAARL